MIYNTSNMPAMLLHPGKRPMHIGGAMMKEIISGIYAIENTVNGHKYIGSAINIEQRWRDHKAALRKGNHHSRYLQNAWNKYEEKYFLFSVIERCQKEHLINREQYYMDALIPEYNMYRKAGSPLGRVMSDETKRKIGNKLKGRTFSEATLIQMSNSAKNKPPRSEETKRKISEGNKGKVGWWKGKPVSIDVKNKISVKLKSFWSDKLIHFSKPINQYSLSGEFIKCYGSMTEAHKVTGFSRSSILSCTSGKKSSACGFIWKYAKGDDK